MYNMYNNCTLQGMTYSGACLRQPHVGQLDWSLQIDGSIIEADRNVSVLCVALFEPRKASCFRQMAALHSDHYRQVPLVGAGCFRQVAALHSDV